MKNSKTIFDRFLAHIGLYRRRPKREKRLCVHCGRQVKRSHHWHYSLPFDGPAHWNCDSPEWYPRKKDAEQVEILLNSPQPEKESTP